MNKLKACRFLLVLFIVLAVIFCLGLFLPDMKDNKLFQIVMWLGLISQLIQAGVMFFEIRRIKKDMQKKGHSGLCIIGILAFLSTSVVSCNKENQTVEPIPEKVVFNLTVSPPIDASSYKLVKTEWEKGDVIFVFFSGVPSPQYLKMSYNGTSWTSTEMNGSSSGSLGLKNGDKGSLRAVYLPFGNDVTVVADGSDFKFSKTIYSYYLTSNSKYSVADNTVSGSITMSLPGEFVQFFIEDASAVDGAYLLDTDAVVPSGLVSVSSDGSLYETVDNTQTIDKKAGDSMTGYACSGGYLFSGRFVSDYKFGNNYYFAKTKVSEGSREDYYISDEKLTRYNVMILPANNSNSWIPVGKNVTVDLGEFGVWYTCNYGCSIPEDRGEQYASQVIGELLSSGIKIPSEEQWHTLINGTARVILTIHGVYGILFKNESFFLFIPSYPYDPHPASTINPQAPYFTSHIDDDGMCIEVCCQKDDPWFAWSWKGYIREGYM